jgi:hypothetical protein
MILGSWSNDRQTRSDGSVINGIKADPRDFMSAYGSVEKDMVAYEFQTWVRTYDMWVLWEGHDMIRMLLIRRTVHIYQY